MKALIKYRFSDFIVTELINNKELQFNDKEVPCYEEFLNAIQYFNNTYQKKG